MRVVRDDGSSVDLGRVEAAPTIGIIDYSRRTTDDFGVTTVVRRGFSRRMSLRLGIQKAEVDAVQRQLADLRAEAATWIADARYGSLSFRGFYKDFDLTVGPLPICTLTVESLAADEAFADPGGDPAPDGRPSTLRFIDPATIDAGTLLSSTVAEDDAAPWAAGATYAKGARTILTATHRVYESLVDGNVGNDPSGTGGKWLDTGPTNRWAMFEQALGTSTISTGDMEVALRAVAPVSGLALLDTNAASIRVRAPGYDRTQVPDPAGKALFLDLAIAPGASITVTAIAATNGAQPQRWDDGGQWLDQRVWSDSLVAGDGTVTIGTLLMGALRGVGRSETAPTAGIIDYSRKETDDFGEVTVVPRAWAKRIAAKALIRTDAVDLVTDRLAATRARPCLWLGHDDLDALAVYGFFRDFEITAGTNVSTLSLSIEGLSKAAAVVSGGIGGSVAWPDITDPTGTKPADNADVTGDNTAKDTNAVGGRPSAVVVAQLDKITPITEATELLKLAEINQDAILAQADRDRAALAAAQISSLLDQNVQRVTLRNAGLVTDPDTGRVYIYALDQTQQRMSKVEIGLDAVSGQIALRATYNDVATMITQAQLSPGDAAEFGNIIQRLNTVELDINSLAGTLVLKADAITVTQLGGVVQTMALTLDALAGQMTSKVSYTDFNLVRDRVGAAEQTLLSYGDVSSYGVTVRQAELRENAGAAAQLAGLVTNFEAGRRQVSRAAEVQQQLYARLVDGDAAEAAARLLLSVRVGAAEGRIASEELVRARETDVLTRSLSTLSTSLGNLGTVVTTLSEATTANDETRGRQINQLSARIGDFGLVSVQQAFSVLADRTGKIEGTATLAIDTNGNVVGFKLIGSPAGPGSLNLVNTDLRMGTGRVIFNNGTFMRVQGTGFGAGGEFISWFGPSMAIEACSRMNAISYETVTGDAYFGGAVSAGILKNAVQTTSLAADAAVSTGPFGSNGKPRNVVLSYSWVRRVTLTGGGSATGTPRAQIHLTRTAGGGPIAILDVVGTTQVQPANGADPGFIREQMSGSVTFTDTTGGSTADYTAAIASRTLADFSGAYTGETLLQLVSLVSTEQ